MQVMCIWDASVMIIQSVQPDLELHDELYGSE